MGAFSDATLQLINQQLQRRNDLLKALAVKYKKTTWDAIQEQVKTGYASDYWNVGDLLVCNYTDDSRTVFEFPWAVAGFRDVYWPNDDLPHPGMILQSVYDTGAKVTFDPPENWLVDSATETTALDGWYYWGLTGNTYTALNLSTGDPIPFADYTTIHKCGINDLTVLTLGYNRYRDSSIRQWINSEAAVGEWWHSTHLGDKKSGVSYYGGDTREHSGFLHGLDADFLAVINPIKIQAATNTTTDGGVIDVMYDRFWLPSVEEMFGVTKSTAQGIEGSYFPYWKEKTGLSDPSNSANSGRIVYQLRDHNSVSNCWARTAQNNAASGYILQPTGGISTSYNAGAQAYSVIACAIS